MMLPFRTRQPDSTTIPSSESETVFEPWDHIPWGKEFVDPLTALNDVDFEAKIAQLESEHPQWVNRSGWQGWLSAQREKRLARREREEDRRNVTAAIEAAAERIIKAILDNK